MPQLVNFLPQLISLLSYLMKKFVKYADLITCNNDFFRDLKILIPYAEEHDLDTIIKIIRQRTSPLSWASDLNLSTFLLSLLRHKKEMGTNLLKELITHSASIEMDTWELSSLLMIHQHTLEVKTDVIKQDCPVEELSSTSSAVDFTETMPKEEPMQRPPQHSPEAHPAPLATSQLITTHSASPPIQNQENISPPITPVITLQPPTMQTPYPVPAIVPTPPTPIAAPSVTPYTAVVPETPPLTQFFTPLNPLPTPAATSSADPRASQESALNLIVTAVNAALTAYQSQGIKGLRKRHGHSGQNRIQKYKTELDTIATSGTEVIKFIMDILEKGEGNNSSSSFRPILGKHVATALNQVSNLQISANDFTTSNYEKNHRFRDDLRRKLQDALNLVLRPTNHAASSNPQ